MCKRETGLRRLIARMRAILDEDWVADAGKVFRRGVSAISDVNEEYLHLEDKAAEAPELAWRAVQGLAGEKHAKAVADYAKAENERIDIALKRRIFDDKARQEHAAADKLEAEAALAKLNELKARVELATALQGLGVALTVETGGAILVRTSARLTHSEISGIFTLPEKRLLQMITEVVAPSDIALGADDRSMTLTKWLCKVGETVQEGEPIFQISTDVLETEVPCPTGGVISEILVDEGAKILPEQTVVCRIEKR